MRAVSFVGTVEYVAEQVERLYRLHTFDSHDEIWERLDTSLGAVDDLTALCVAALPLPSLRDPPVPEDDETVHDALSRLAKNPNVRGERVADGCDRLVSVDGHLIVPLRRTGPTAANWYVLFRWLADRLELIARQCRRLADRLFIEGATFLGESWADLGQFLEEVAFLLVHVESMTRWIDTPGDGLDDRTRRLPDVATKLAEQSIEHR